MTPEKEVQNDIVDYLTELEKAGMPLMHDRRQAGGFSYKKGIPDLYAVYNGIHIEIEVKAPGEEQTSMQEKWQMKCEMLNIPYVCADCVEDVTNLLRKLGLPS